MRQLSKQETNNLNRILEADPELFIKFKQKLDFEPEIYEENFEKDFDHDFFAEFMNKKLEKILTLNRSELLGRLEQERMTEEQIIEVFEESGSTGLSMLIEEFIKKMCKDKVISSDTLDILVGMIHARNKLQSYEISFLQAEYKIFLKNKLNFYQNNNG